MTNAATKRNLIVTVNQTTDTKSTKTVYNTYLHNWKF